ncbi:MAG: hypothetical protein COB54_01625 [Alphaproteobacteria bacterium]|nr:MAG: hypothetical protein COB54_01625 [Alphaproteobacteria bacterium]
MKILRVVHLWVGLTVGGILFFTAFSGTVLVFKYDLLNLSLPDNAPLYRPPTLTEKSRAMTQLKNAQTRLIRFPSPGLNYYVHADQDTVQYYHPDSLQRVTGRYHIPLMLRVLSDLHIHLLAGKTGEKVLGFLGLGLLFLCLSGLVIWFPGRRGFRVRSSLPKKVSRGSFLASHRSAGVLSCLMILLLTTTGVGMVFYDISKDLIRGLIGEESPASTAAAPVTIPPQRGDFRSWPEILQAVAQSLPGGRITLYYAPKQVDNRIQKFRLRYDEDWTPNGASFIQVDPYSARAVAEIDYRTAPTSDRIARKLFPLHTGAIGGRSYQLIVALTGLFLMLMIGTAFGAWVKKKRQAGRGGKCVK